MEHKGWIVGSYSLACLKNILQEKLIIDKSVLFRAFLSFAWFIQKNITNYKTEV